MSEKLSGVYSSTDIGGFTPDQAVSRGAIGVVGHMLSGTSVSGSDKFSSANPLGTVYEFTSIVEAKATLGTTVSSQPLASGSNWIAGTFGGNDAIAGFDLESNLIRGLELIYLGNPRAKTYVAVLSGAGTNASTVSDGTAEALAELMKHEDIEFITGAGLEFNATYLSHATSSDDDANQAERVYVGGISLNDAYSGSTDTNKQDTFDVSAYTSLSEDTGRSICFIGNANYTFGTGYASGSVVEPSKEIGGNWVANFVAGYLSQFAENISILNKGIFGFLPVYNGKAKLWSSTELETNYDNSHLSIRFSASNSPAYYFEKAMTHAPKTSAWGRITRRRIIDRVLKDVRVILRAELGQPNIASRRRAINDRVKRRLLQLLDDGLLQDTVSSTVFVQTGDTANGILRANVNVTPVGEIEEVRLTVGVVLV